MQANIDRVARFLSNQPASAIGLSANVPAIDQPLNERIMGSAMMSLMGSAGDDLSALMTCSLEVDGDALTLHGPAEVADRLDGPLARALEEAAREHGVTDPRITLVPF
jgi:hypothetical protein